MRSDRDSAGAAVLAVPDPLRHLEAELADLDRRGLLRRPPEPVSRAAGHLLVLCSNDYLGYAASPWPGERSVSGSGASRLVTGEHPEHAEAERAIAAWLRVGASLLFSSGYAANVGAIAALARRGDIVLSDALNHASIIDGCRLSGARVIVYPHRDIEAVERALREARSADSSGAAEVNDPTGPSLRAQDARSADSSAASEMNDPNGPALRAQDARSADSSEPSEMNDPNDPSPRARDARSAVACGAVEDSPVAVSRTGAAAEGAAAEAPAAESPAPEGARPRVWVVTESLFSMDGDTPDLRALRALCDAHDAALYVDEAHAVGVVGPEGRGACAEAGIVPDVLVGTLGKALGLQGAFVAGSPVLRAYLWNRARSFVFSTGVSPALAARVAAQVERAARDDAARARLAESASRLREGLTRLGMATLPSARGPILPWLVGAPDEALARSRALREEGVLVQPIRPPTVPKGTSRLRITATAALTSADIDRALTAFARALRPT